MSQMHSRTQVEKWKLSVTIARINIINKHRFFNAKIEKK